jgi:hypothetical protein
MHRDVVVHSSVDDALTAALLLGRQHEHVAEPLAELGAGRRRALSRDCSFLGEQKRARDCSGALRLSERRTELAGEAAAPPGVPTTRQPAGDVVASDDEHELSTGFLQVELPLLATDIAAVPLVAREISACC